MPTLQERIETATATIETDKGKLHDIVHGPASGASSQVTTDNGLVKTVARVVQENADFIAASLATLDQKVADAAGSATSAASSASAAQAAAASGLFSAVQDKSAAYTVVEADAGDLFRVSTGGGAATITLPQISALSAGVRDGFKLAVVKWTGDANAVTVQRSGADTINGAASLQISGQYQTIAFVADAETSEWAATDMSLDSGSLRKDQNLADLPDKPAAFANIKQAASESATGVVELATQAEAEVGTDNVRVLTALRVAQAIAALGNSTALSSDLKLLALEVAALKGDRLNMANGWADPLKDETDIETAQNVNATYVSAGGGYYHNPSGYTQIAQGTGTVVGNADARQSNAFDGTTSQNAAASAEKNTAPKTLKLGKDWGSGVTKTVSQYKIYGSSDQGFINADTAVSVTAKLFGSNTAFDSGGVQLHTAAFTDPDNGTVQTFNSGIDTSTAYRWHWVEIYRTTPSGSEYVDCAEVEFFETVLPSNMTVVSKNVIDAASAPATGRLHVQINDVTGGSTVNTDFKGYVSRDNGTTYTQGTLALVQTLADGIAAYEFDSLDISGQPSGTDMRFKFTTHNNKQIELHGALVQWK